MNFKFPHWSLSDSLHVKLISPLFILAMTSLFYSCSGENKNTEGDSTGESVFHADDDIAMVMQSIADAIKVGEPLTPQDYNFTGVLTDGTGRPLYTDMDGMPGEWTIEVSDSTTATVRNIKIGDLAAQDLEYYISSALQIDPETVYEGRNFNGRRQIIYSIPGGYLAMTSKTDTLSNGLTGDKISIVIKK